MNKDVLARKIKKEWPELDNKQVNGFAIELWSDVSEWHKEDRKRAIEAITSKAKEVTKARAEELMTDDELALEVNLYLQTKLREGTLTAQDINQLREIANIKKQDRDIVIKVVNYKDVENAKPEEAENE